MFFRLIVHKGWFFGLLKSWLFVCLQMKPGAKTVVSWCIAWLASAAQSLWLWLISCRSSTCQWMMLMTLSRWRNPTSPPTSTSWANCWTSREHWDSAAPVTTGSLHSSSTSPPPPTRMSTKWTPCNPREKPHTPLRWEVSFSSFSWQHQLLSFYVARSVQMTPAVCIRQGDHVWNWLYKARDLLHARLKNRTCCVDR